MFSWFCPLASSLLFPGAREPATVKESKDDLLPFYFYLKQGLMWPWFVWNSLCRPGWPGAARLGSVPAFSTRVGGWFDPGHR